MLPRKHSLKSDLYVCFIPIQTTHGKNKLAVALFRGFRVEPAGAGNNPRVPGKNRQISIKRQTVVV